jgi:hypothetical protein
MQLETGAICPEQIQSTDVKLQPSPFPTSMAVGCAEEVLISKTNVGAWILTIDNRSSWAEARPCGDLLHLSIQFGSLGDEWRV